MIKRKYRWRKGLCAALAGILLFSAPTEAKADVYWPEGPSIVSPSAIVIEVNSGAVLYEKNADQVNYPASITKVMTTLLALEHCDLDEIVTFSDDAIKYNQGDTSHIARDYGEEMTMKECLYAVMLESANECAYAVAEHVGVKLGGDYKTFIDLMNERAKELGCTNTHFNNSNGLPDKEHWTSAHDMGLISAEAYKNETFRVIVGSRNYKIPPTNKHKEPTYLNNHHAMISNYKTDEFLYEYSTGGKTGYTDSAAFTLVSYAEKDDLTLACVVMKTNADARFRDTKNLFEHCFQNYQAISIDANGSTGDAEAENNGIMINHESFVKLDENAHVVLPITADVSDVEMTLVKEDLKEGSIAKLMYTYGGHVAGCVDVIFANAVVEENYFDGSKKPTDVNIVEIKPIYVAIAVLILIGIIVAIIFGKRLYDNYYVILHDMEVRKQRRDRFRPIERKRKRRSRNDRMFR